MHRKSLHYEIAPTDSIRAEVVRQLYDLYEQCYDGSNPERFEADLREKQWVILLREAASQRTVGFSTQMLIDIEVEGESVRALFSGDTVIHPGYWGSQELVRAWCRLAGRLKARSMDRPLYWFLVSKGYRTYLYLPTFFHRFYPRCDQPNSAFVERLIHALGSAKYPGAFDPRTGLIEHLASHDRLKPELDAIARHARNPHVEFFVRRNPNYRNGTELLCVAEISPENMRSTARRELEFGLDNNETWPGLPIDRGVTQECS
jgi:hypothetical protein